MQNNTSELFDLASFMTNIVYGLFVLLLGWFGLTKRVKSFGKHLKKWLMNSFKFVNCKIKFLVLKRILNRGKVNQIKVSYGSHVVRFYPKPQRDVNSYGFTSLRTMNLFKLRIDLLDRMESLKSLMNANDIDSCETTINKLKIKQ